MRIRFSVLYVICLSLFSSVSAQNNVILNPTRIADSLSELGNYKAALPFREQALKYKNHSSNYLKIIKAKWHFTKACILETKGGRENHLEALKNSLKAREIVREISSPIQDFKYDIANRIYHEYGYIGNWKMAHIEAKNCLNILLDTLPIYHRRSLLVIDDLGFVNTKMGDTEKALEYYKISDEYYPKYFPEKKWDIATNSYNIALNYEKLGMKNQELKYLLKTEAYSSNLNEGKNLATKFDCYGKLSAWHSYYGRYNLAETYLFQQREVLDSLIKWYKPTERENEGRAKKLDLYANFIDFFLSAGKSEKAEEFIKKSETFLGTKKNRTLKDIHHQINLFKLKSRLPNGSAEYQIEMLKEAISLAKNYQEQYFTNPLPIQIQLINIYIKYNFYNRARTLLDNVKNNPGLTITNSFLLSTYESQILIHEGQLDYAVATAEKGIEKLLKDNNRQDIVNISLSDLYPVYSFEIVEGLLTLGRVYLKLHLINNNHALKEKSLSLTFLASGVFNNIYQGDRYNKKLNETFNDIQALFLPSLSANSNQKTLIRIIDSLEKNRSKISLEKFQYSISRSNLELHDSLKIKESDLKGKLAYYNDLLYNRKQNVELEIDTLKVRLNQSKLHLQRLQNEIGNLHSTKIENQLQDFSFNGLQKKLDTKTAILKYIIFDNRIYNLAIKRKEILFNQIPNSEKIIEELIGLRESYNDINKHLPSLSSITNAIVPRDFIGDDTERLIIIPDGILHFLPFESFITDIANMQESLLYSISYASSLTLLNEQMEVNKNNNIEVGIFYGSGTEGLELPHVNNEIEVILKNFNSAVYKNLERDKFIDKAKKHGILHLALHTEINSLNPEYSSFILGTDKLPLFDLSYESLNAELAVLSGCETATGSFEQGEGILGTSRYFQHAGVPSIIASLWKVDDRSTSIIMSSLYAHLKEGASKDEALRLAKEDYLAQTEDEALKHPYYWAGFVVMGNTEPIIEKKQNDSTYFIFAIIAVIGIVGFTRYSLVS